MNKELLSPKDIIIAKLKVRIRNLERQIKEFKKYDEKRKEYYKFLVEDWQNSDAQHIIEDLRGTVKKQAEQIKTLQSINSKIKVLAKYTEEELKGFIKNFNKIQQADTVRALQEKLRKLKIENERLFHKLLVLENKQNKENV